jgi:bifunctional DNA-binding transcriptional regulator/antitoxin component of YhaV-PrlF toxin-antitoxin module
MLAKKTAKNQVTLPKEIADRFPDTVYFDVRVEGNKITLRPARIETEGEGQDLGSIREKVRRLGVTEKDVAAAIRWARRKG